MADISIGQRKSVVGSEWIPYSQEFGRDIFAFVVPDAEDKFNWFARVFRPEHQDVVETELSVEPFDSIEAALADARIWVENSFILWIETI